MERIFGEDSEAFGTCVRRVMYVGNAGAVEQMGLKGPNNEDCTKMRDLVCISTALRKREGQ